MQVCNQKYEISKICRCCLKSIGEMKPLFGFSLDEMLRSIANLQVEPNDGLPQLLCFQCVLQLSRGFRFREQCIRSNSTIRDYLRNSANTNSYPCQEINVQTKEDRLENTNEEIEDYGMIYEPDHDSSQIAQDCDKHRQPLNKRDEIQTTVECKNINITCIEFKCKICNKQFARRKQLLRHIKIHDDNKPFKCSECDKSFAERCNLKKHTLKHTGELRNATSKPYLCSICGSSFKYSSSLSKHMKFHTGKNLLHCSHCPKYYVEKSALEIHLRCHTGDRPHSCPQCNRRFTQACNLQKHLRSHSGDRAFKCTICARSFIERDYLTTHMQTHNSQKKALCSTCGKNFANSKTLDAHMRIHADERPYHCGYGNCNKTFTRLDTAMVHRRIHTGERPYSCETCSNSFTTASQLSNHLRTHSGEKLFTCEVCQKKFASRSSLKSHSSKHLNIRSEEVIPINPKNQQENAITGNFPYRHEDFADQRNQEIADQIFEESVLLFKINESGELVPEAECTSIANVSTIKRV